MPLPQRCGSCWEARTDPRRPRLEGVPRGRTQRDGHGPRSGPRGGAGWLRAVDKYITDCLAMRAEYLKLPYANVPVLVEAGAPPTRWTREAAAAIAAHKSTTGQLPLEEALI